jgi:membrane protein implicated in regulation of membrane protease activity
MIDEENVTGRCGWIALALVLFFLQGILPGSFLGGIAGLKAAGDVLGQNAGSDLVIRLFVLVGMIVSFLVLAVISMLVAMVASRIVLSRVRRSVALVQEEEKALMER